MLDTRSLSYLTFSETLSFTGTAERLHLTQPAISQHLRGLEEHYGVQLIVREGRQNRLTPAGELLAITLRSLDGALKNLPEQLQAAGQPQRHLRMGATLTVGEFVMPGILSALLAEEPDLDLVLEIHNTRILLEMLNRGELDLLLVEGLFDKTHYRYRLLSHERFIPAAAAGSPLAGGSHRLEDLLGQRLLVRESGSGSRLILEQTLAERGLKLESFRRHTVIGNINALKEMLMRGHGISFVYEQAILKELRDGTLSELYLEDLEINREFNFVGRSWDTPAGDPGYWIDRIGRLHREISGEGKSDAER